ncbi:MAG: SPASM domain-containing protein [Nitrospirae bacterium]|nr:SPASM domain-containing protein [Nitrospirota bacterium]
MKIITKYVRKYLGHKYKVAYRKKLIELPYSPREFWIEPTNHCNLRCVMCPHGKGLHVQKGYMDMGLYLRIINELRVLNVQRINLFLGGESLLHKKLAEMIAIARDYRIPVRLHTNAAFLTADLSTRLLENGGLEEISFSFDGEEKDYYERVRVNAKFENTLANIRRFLEIKKSRALGMPRVIVQVIKERKTNGSTPVLSDKFKALFEGLPVDKFNPICFHNFGGMLEVTGDVKYEVAKKEYKPCHQPWRSMSVAWDGEVVGCCLDMEKKLILGNLRTQGIMEVWNGKPSKEFRQALAAERYADIELCRECDQLWI